MHDSDCTVVQRFALGEAEGLSPFGTYHRVHRVATLGGICIRLRAAEVKVTSPGAIWVSGLMLQ